MYTHIIRYRWSIVFVTLVTATAAWYFSHEQTPIYESATTVLVDPVTLGGGSEPLRPLNMATEEQVAVSIPIAQRVRSDVGSTETAAELLDDLSVESVPGTEILTFTYEHPDPAVAQRRSEAFAISYLEFRSQQVDQQVAGSLEDLQQDISTLQRRISRLMREIAATPRAARGPLQSRAGLLTSLLVRKELQAIQLESTLEVGRVAEPAALPMTPIRPNHRLNLALGLAVGLLLAAGQAVLRGRLSRRIQSIHELEALTKRPVLGAIPRSSVWRRRRRRLLLITDHRVSKSVVEAYRFLRGSVLAATSPHDAKLLLVTSVAHDEGKTSIAANLAVGLAKLGKDVVVISADFRGSSLEDIFMVSRQPGLLDVLSAGVPLRQALVQLRVDGTSIRFLSRGTPVPEPAELLGSAKARGLLERLRGESDYVILDAPPISEVADTATLAPATDGVLLVVDVRRSDAVSVLAARRQVEQIGVPLIGAVFNQVNVGQLASRFYHHAQESSSQAGVGIRQIRRTNDDRISQLPRGRR